MLERGQGLGGHGLGSKAMTSEALAPLEPKPGSESHEPYCASLKK